MWMKFISARPLDMQIENVQTGPIHAHKTANINEETYEYQKTL